MKPKEFFYLLGLRPKPKVFGTRIQRIELPEGTVEYARWLAPEAKDLRLAAEELAQLRRFIGEGDFAIDVGAQVGDSTLPIALACGVTGLVLALEPNPYTFKILAANSKLNPARTHIVPMNVASTDHDGTFTFEYGTSSFSNGGYHAQVSKWRHGSAFKIQVEGRRLDRILQDQYADWLPRLRYLKTDCEGHDLAVLRSIEKIIAAHRPHIKAEVGKYAPEADRREMHRMLTALGYAVHRFDGAEHPSGELLTESDIVEWKRHLDVFAVP